MIIDPPVTEERWRGLGERARVNRARAAKLEEALALFGPKDPRKRERLRLSSEREMVVTSLNQDEALIECLSAAVARTRALLRCPVCANAGTSYDFSNAGGRSFRAHCPSCESVWGLKDCRSCGALFPFINNPECEPALAAVDIDGACGCDILAFPVAKDVFLCTGCGRRTDGEAD